MTCRYLNRASSGSLPGFNERFPDTAIIPATGGEGNEPPVISLQPGVVVYLAMPFGCEAVLKAVRVGLLHMSLPVRAKKDDRTNSVETGLATDNQE